MIENRKIIKDYLNNPDKFVYHFIVHEKDKDRNIITYNDALDYGKSLRKFHDEFKQQFEGTFYSKSKFSYAYEKGIKTIDAFKDHLLSTHFVKIDIHHFFESINENVFLNLYGYLFNEALKDKIRSCFYKGSLSIGFVTSPVISNFFMQNFDKTVEQYINNHKGLHYSRYSDDILLSSECETNESLNEFNNYIEKELKNYNLTINDKKTKAISLNFEKKNSISFLGLAISKKDVNSCKITVSKRYILFLLSLIKKNKVLYNDKCHGLNDEIRSRVAYLYYSSMYSYERFQKKYFNIYGTYYEFNKVINKKPKMKKVKVDLKPYFADFIFEEKGKIIDNKTGVEIINNGIIIQKYIGRSNQVVIPDFVDGLGENSFSRANISKVICNDRLKAIGKCAFNSSTLKEIIFGNSLEYIGEYAFSECKQLKELLLPDDLKEIRNNAFENCCFLDKVILPNKLITIPDHCFSGDYKIKEIDLPSSLMQIGACAFQNTSLENLYLGSNIVDIDKQIGIFTDIPNLKKVKLDSTNKVYYSINGCLIESNSNELVYVPRDNNIIPSVVEIIGEGCFFSSKIEEIVIPENVKEIRDLAFKNCYKLKKVIFETNKLELIGNQAFDENSLINNISLPNSIVKIGYKAFNNCKSMNISNWPKELIFIGSYAFRNNYSLNSIILQNKVQKIGNNAFENCYSVESIFIPQLTNVIGQNAFLNTSCNLKNIFVDSNNENFSSKGNCLIDRKTLTLLLGCASSVIPQNIISIADFAFLDCKSIEMIELPNSVVHYGKNMFKGCLELKEITFPNSLNNFNIEWFENCPNITNIKISNNNIYYVVDNCLISKFHCEANKYGVTSRERVNKILLAGSMSKIPNQIENLVIGESCFRNRKGIDEIVIPNNVIKIENYAFAFSSIKRIKFNNSHLLLSDGLFAYSDLEELDLSYLENNFKELYNSNNFNRNIPYGIPNRLCIGCSKLSKVILPDFEQLGISYIGKSAFKDTSLIDFNFPKTLELIDEKAFENSKITNIRIPPRVSKIGDDAFANTSCITLEIPSSFIEFKANCFEKSRLESIKVYDNGNNIYFKDCNSNAIVSFNKENILIVGCKNTILNNVNNINIIGKEAFKNVSLYKLVIPDSIKEIKTSAFENCNLKEVSLGNNLTKISDKAFQSNNIEKIYNYSNTILKDLSCFNDNPIKEINGKAFGNGVVLLNGIKEEYNLYSNKRNIFKGNCKTLILTSDTNVTCGFIDCHIEKLVLGPHIKINEPNIKNLSIDYIELPDDNDFYVYKDGVLYEKNYTYNKYNNKNSYPYYVTSFAQIPVECTKLPFFSLNRKELYIPPRCSEILKLDLSLLKKLNINLIIDKDNPHNDLNKFNESTQQSFLLNSFISSYKYDNFKKINQMNISDGDILSFHSDFDDELPF